MAGSSRSRGLAGSRRLVSGFVIILVSVAVLALLIFRQLSNLDDLQAQDKILSIKTAAAFRMSESIRNRNFSLAVVPTHEDFFDRDEERERFAGYARDFLHGREALIGAGLDDAESAALDNVIDAIRNAQPVVEAAMTQAVENGNTPAVRELVSRGWQTQTLALKALDKFAQTVNQRAELRTNDSRNVMRLDLKVAVSLGILAFLLSAATAFFVTRREIANRGALMEASDQISILNERLQEENVRISSELDVAQKLQEMILPRDAELMAITELDIAAHMTPADEVGGDYYDVLQCCEGHVLIGIGDVTGHGLESGVIMLMVQSVVRALLEKGDPDLRQALATINQVIYRNSARMNTDKNLSLAVIHYFDQQIKIAGQHEEVLVIRNGDIERVDTIDLGFPIGLEENITPFIGEYGTHLDEDDIVVLYTDGIPEAENTAGALYGMDRMCEIIGDTWQQSSADIRTALVDDVNAFIGDGKVHDDVTLVVIKRR